MIRSGRAQTATEVQQEAFPSVTPQLVRAYLTAMGLPGHRRRRKFILTRDHKRQRRFWARQHENWSVQDWERVVFTDEFRINRWGSDGNQYCRRGPGEEFREDKVDSEMKHGGGSIMVWGCITSRGYGRLHRIEGNMKADQYVSILQESLLGTLRDHSLSPSDIIFQHDNDPKHTAKLTSRWLASQDFSVMPWPAGSPDMNAAEHVWNRLKNRVGAVRPCPHNLDELWEVVQREWQKLDNEFLESLYESMPRRVHALKDAKGSYTKY